MTDEIDDDTLVHDMIEVHGSGAATVARDTARTPAALAWSNHASEILDQGAWQAAR